MDLRNEIEVLQPLTEKQFMMTYARSRPNQLIPWIEANDVPLLTNAVHRWSDHTDRFLDMWEYDTTHVIDAGGYNVQATYADQYGNLKVDESEVKDELMSKTPFYPWGVDEYHSWLSEWSHEFDWATAMDYACEDRFNELWDVESRIEATFQNTIRHYNRLEDSDADYKLLPVLQGRSIEAYVDFYDRLNDYGIPTDHVGLGTICRLSSEKRIVELEKELRKRTDVDRIHGFGAKIEAFKHGGTFDSADSQAWAWGPSNGYCLIDDGDRLREITMTEEGDSLHRTVESFKNYYSYVTRLQQGESAIEYDSGVTGIEDDDLARSTIRAEV